MGEDGKWEGAGAAYRYVDGCGRRRVRVQGVDTEIPIDCRGARSGRSGWSRAPRSRVKTCVVYTLPPLQTPPDPAQPVAESATIAIISVSTLHDDD
ncbi:hypothetical protein KL939_005101 [Ogataea angusta]|nr:hypothetical protein KL939_005101 [Ogataea angusta]